MKFRKYNEIENAYRQVEIDRIRANGFDNESIKWSATEKVDGSNLSVWISPDTIRVGKRSGFLSPEEIFYNHTVVIDKYKNDFYRIYQILNENRGYQLPFIVLYGEIFGGYYRHPDITPVKNSKKVQNRINYCPHNDFYVFDIAVPNTETDSLNFIDAIEFEMACANTDLLFAKSLFSGTFDECLQFDINFNSTIPQRFGLPPIEDNYSEGVVMKPDYPLYYDNGDRVILKNKREEFTEVKVKIPKIAKDIPQEVPEYIEHLKNYITDSRYVSVVSKIGDVSFDDFSKIMKDYSEDVTSEFIKDYPEFETLDKDIKKQITKELGRLISQLIRKNLME
jgi:Rnl2 family RNA ligase